MLWWLVIYYFLIKQNYKQLKIMKLENILNEKEIKILKTLYPVNMDSLDSIIKNIQLTISEITDFAYKVIEANGNTEVSAEGMQLIYDGKKDLLSIRIKCEKARNGDYLLKKQIAEKIVELTPDKL